MDNRKLIAVTATPKTCFDITGVSWETLKRVAPASLFRQISLGKRVLLLSDYAE